MNAHPAPMQRSSFVATVIGALAAVAGVLVLLSYATSEVLADPSLSLEDGYWIGRVPWTPMGVGLVVAGSTLAIVAGTALVLLRGGNIRRVTAVAACLPAAYWWLLASVPLVAFGGAWCGQPTCPQPSSDVITIAYSLPESTVFLLLLPALIVTTVALAPRRSSVAEVT